MNEITGAAGANGLLAPGPAKDSPQAIREAASQFEALFVAELLKHVRETSSGGLLAGGEDESGLAMIEIAEEQFAQALARQGGLGLSRMVAESLQPAVEDAPKAPPAHGSR